ncbi:MAG: YraN family protein [Bacteroidales bacterium]|jgi:putative endonuclease|nr:YraN family protein [Bacteroidales bacterium]
MAEHHKTGKEGEAIALNFLLRENYHIIATNWRQGHLELDIIAKENDLLVFIEVKTRHSIQWGEPETFVNKKKQRFLAQAANEYILQSNYHGEVRFDILGILIAPKGARISHIKDAFFPGLF